MVRQVVADDTVGCIYSGDLTEYALDGCMSSATLMKHPAAVKGLIAAFQAAWDGGDLVDPVGVV